MADKARIRDSGHQVYKTADGTRVPGVTTICGVMDKPALVKWANNLGLQGTDSTKYVDALAASGTLAHYWAEEVLIGREPDQAVLDEYAPPLESMVEAQKLAKSAASALSFEDVPTAVRCLEDALRALKAPAQRR